MADRTDQEIEDFKEFLSKTKRELDENPSVSHRSPDSTESTGRLKIVSSSKTGETETAGTTRHLGHSESPGGSDSPGSTDSPVRPDAPNQTGTDTKRKRRCRDRESDRPEDTEPLVHRPNESRHRSPFGGGASLNLDAAKILNLVLAAISIVIGIVIVVNIKAVLAALCVFLYYLVVGAVVIAVIAGIILFLVMRFRRGRWRRRW